MNRVIESINQRLRQLWERIKQLKDWLKEATTNTAPPTLASVLQGILEGGDQQNGYGKIRDLKMAARVYYFMQENGISKMSELREMYSDVHDRYNDARQDLRFYDQRIKTLDENIKQGDNYIKYRDLYAEYKNLKPRKQPKFYEAHRADLMLFEAARRYFKEQYISTDFSLNEWKQGREKLPAERAKAYREYNVVQAQFSVVENARMDAKQIVRNLNAPQRKPRAREMGR